MIRRFWFLSFVVIVTACGFKPTSVYTKKVLGDRIYVKVETSLQDPENSVLIRDALNEAVINKFKARLSQEADATATLFTTLKRVDFQPIEFDKNGYVIAYKTNVLLQTRFWDRLHKVHTVETTGDFDFNIESNSVISDTKRFNAIKEAAQKSIDAFISKISVQGVKIDHQ